jgi:hypothetical protein
MKKLLIIAGCLVTYFAFGQDSIRIRNRHTSPDTTTKDTTKLKGGSLVDTIHTQPKTKKELKEMQRPTDSLRKESMLSGSELFAQNDDLSKEIEQLESRIMTLKKKQMTASEKSALASVENQKNELKQRIKNGEVNQPGAKEKWNADLAKIKERISKLEGKS